MISPKVVGEWKRHIPELMPPAVTRPHQWLSAESAERFGEIASSGMVFDIYMTAFAERKITEQASEAAPMRLEVMGLLLELRQGLGGIGSSSYLVSILPEPMGERFAHHLFVIHHHDPQTLRRSLWHDLSTSQNGFFVGIGTGVGFGAQRQMYAEGGPFPG